MSKFFTWIKAIWPDTNKDRFVFVCLLLVSASLSGLNYLVIYQMYQHGFRTAILLEVLGLLVVINFICALPVTILRFTIYRSRRINAVPQLSAISITENTHPYKVKGRMYEVHWLNFVVRLILYDTKGKRHWTTGLHGPTWTLPTKPKKDKV